MADTQNAPASGNTAGTGASVAGAAPSPKQNPALRMMGTVPAVDISPFVC